MNTNDKATLTTLFLIATLPNFTMAIVPTPWYHTYFHGLRGANYKKNCALIDFAQKIRGAALVLYYRTTHKTANLDKALSAIENQLTAFEQWLIDLEHQTLLAIKQKYAMDGLLWQKCLADIERVKKSYQNGMLTTRDDIIHDDAIPADVLQIITTLLEQNNINPYSICLEMVTDKDKIANQRGTIAEAVTLVASTLNDSDKSITIESEYIPCIIKLFPRIKNASPSQHISFFAHEIQHLVSQHSITEIILIKYLTHHYSVDEAEFKKSAEYRQLCQIQEAQAEVLAAIKNPQIAHHLKQMRKNSYYPNHLYEEHFFHVATIDMLWNVHNKLESIILLQAC